jgi:alanine dehydrogenase
VRVYDLPSIAAAASAPTSVASGSLILSGGISGIIPAAGVVHTTEGVVSATEAVVAAISGWSVASPGGVAH